MILTERPIALHHDSETRLHCEDGPALSYRDGWSIWAIHGVRVPEKVVMTPSALSRDEVLGERNAEVRRVMVERLGHAQFLDIVGAKPIHEDRCGKLYRINLAEDEPITLVEVVNSTAEPDGHFKRYFLRVHPECRPLLANGEMGDPQKLTAANAIASTFGRTGAEYRPLFET